MKGRMQRLAGTGGADARESGARPLSGGGGCGGSALSARKTWTFGGGGRFIHLIQLMMGFFLHALKLFLVAYLLFAGFMFVFQRRLLYVPSKSRPSLQKFKGFWEEFRSQTGDGLTLSHWLARRGRPCILVFHGNAGNIEGRAYKFKFLADHGFSVLLAAYRGYGGSPGRPSEKALIADAALTLEALLEREGISALDTVLLGESLGSGVAVALAAMYPVRAVILDGAYSSIEDVAQSVYPFLPVRFLLKDKWDSLSRIQKRRRVAVSAAGSPPVEAPPSVSSQAAPPLPAFGLQAAPLPPFLFIHSRGDSVLPFRFAQKLYEAAGPPERKRALWLDGSGHVDNLDSESVRKAVLDFIESPP